MLCTYTVCISMDINKIKYKDDYIYICVCVCVCMYIRYEAHVCVYIFDSTLLININKTNINKTNIYKIKYMQR